MVSSYLLLGAYALLAIGVATASKPGGAALLPASTTFQQETRTSDVDPDEDESEDVDDGDQDEEEEEEEVLA